MLDSSSGYFFLPIQLPTWEAAEDSLNVWVPDAHVGGPDGAAGPDLAVVALWEVSQETQSTSLCVTVLSKEISQYFKNNNN